MTNQNSSDAASREEREHRLDGARVRANFNRAATTYDLNSAVPNEIGERLLDHLSPVKLTPNRILEAGTGTGRQARVLAQTYRSSIVVATDLATDMLAAARRKTTWWRKRPSLLCCDLQRLPLASTTVDLVFSNLAVHWCLDMDTALGEMARVLRPGGLLAFSTLGPDSCRELRECWSQIDDFVHVHAFMDMHDIGDALVRVGLTDVVMDVERLTVEYSDLPSMLHELKHLGAGNAATGRRRSLTGKSRLRKLTECYELRRREGRLPVTLEVIYAHAWKFRPPVQEVSVSSLTRPRQD